MEEAYEIHNYLPLHFKTPSEEEYVRFLWDTFESNYNDGKFQFGFIAYHMLFMSFVYFNIWQIKKIHEEDYKKITLGFHDCFINASSPFSFSEEGEAKIFKLFKFFGLEDVQIGQYKRIVAIRNLAAHCNGNIHFNDDNSVDEKVTDILRFAEEIQQKTKSAIQDCYKKFLLDSQYIEERRYIEGEEQINEELIHEHYISQKDLEFCFEYDISQLSQEPGFTEIQFMHEKLLSMYGNNE